MIQYNVFVCVAVENTADTTAAKVIIDRTTVLARDDKLAIQKFTIDNAKELKDKEVRILCRPF